MKLKDYHLKSTKYKPPIAKKCRLFLIILVQNFLSSNYVIHFCISGCGLLHDLLRIFFVSIWKMMTLYIYTHSSAQKLTVSKISIHSKKKSESNSKFPFFRQCCGIILSIKLPSFCTFSMFI